MHQLTYEILRECAGKLVFVTENRVLAFLLSKEEVPAEEPAPDDPMIEAWIRRQELKDGVNLRPGWGLTYCVDPSTWLFIREIAPGSPNPLSYMMRVEVTDRGLYKQDYRDGKRIRLVGQEADECWMVVNLFYTRSHERVMPRLSPEDRELVERARTQRGD